jgi:hypothetical protein
MSWKGGFAMFKEVVDGFKRWMTCDEVYSILKSTAKTCDRLCADVKSIDLRIKQLEAAEKSRAEAMDFIASSEESIKPVCDDCVSMRLELDTMKARLEALETAGKGGGEGGQTNNMCATPATPKQRRRRKSDAKEMVA